MLKSIENAASELKLSPWTVRAWAKRGLIKTVRLGSCRLVPVSEIERIAEQGLDTSYAEESDSLSTE